MYRSRSCEFSGFKYICWEDVAKVRKIMKDSGPKKEPTCSWVEIENFAHVFVAMTLPIHRKIRSLNCGRS